MVTWPAADRCEPRATYPSRGRSAVVAPEKTVDPFTVTLARRAGPLASVSDTL